MVDAADGAQKAEAPPPAQSFAERLGDVAKWAVGALAAVGTASIAKLGLDRLGKGDGGYLGIALFSAAVFTAGVVGVISVVIWTTRASRVTIDYIASSKYWIAKRVDAFFSRNPYLLFDNPSVEQFRARLIHLVRAQGEALRAGSTFSEEQEAELTELVFARSVIIETAVAERETYVNKLAGIGLLAGALAVTLGASGFAYAVNRGETLRTDRLEREKKQTTSVLLPAAPAPVLLAVAPSDATKEVRAELTALLGPKCELAGVKAILLEVALRPADALPRAGGSATAVMHVVTERTTDCQTRELWLDPSYVTARPTDKATDSAATTKDAGSATTSTTATTVKR